MREFTKCEQFTLSEAELSSVRTLKSSYLPSRRSLRASTVEKSSKSTVGRRLASEMSKLGPIKSFIFELAEAKSWDEADFKKTKAQLRKQYKVPRNTVNWLASTPKEELLAILISFSFNAQKKIMTGSVTKKE